IVYQENSSYYNHFISCKFNIRDISIFRAFQENIPIILDSDTPSLKTLYNISLKKCLYINFFDKKYIKKVNNNIINLKNEKSIAGLSYSLIKAIQKKIQQKKQVLLIFNKFNIIFLGLMCNNCGFILKCNICNNDYEY
ncbi:primosomal protein N', partial [Buchnera aphidicola]|nr:primosomal protein N' [Buchnera aphidicola]